VGVSWTRDLVDKRDKERGDKSDKEKGDKATRRRATRQGA